MLCSIFLLKTFLVLLTAWDVLPPVNSTLYTCKNVGNILLFVSKICNELFEKLQPNNVDYCYIIYTASVNFETFLNEFE